MAGKRKLVRARDEALAKVKKLQAKVRRLEGRDRRVRVAGFLAGRMAEESDVQAEAADS